MAMPAQSTVINGREHLRLALPCPGREFLAIKNVARAAGSVEQDQTSVLITIAENFVDDGPERSQPDSSGNDNDIAATGNLHRPARTEGPAHGNAVPNFAAHQCVGRLAYGTHGVNQ